MKKAALAITAVLLLLLATACGGNDSTSSAKPTGAEKTVIDSVVKEITSTNGLLDATSASCVATKFVTSVGVKKLQTVKAVGADNLYIANGALVDAATSAAYTKALLSCVKESDALATLKTNAETGYGQQTQGVLATAQVHCLIAKFVDATGVAKLFSSQFVTDSGEFQGAGQAYDDDTAGKFADALVACVDYPKLQAQDAAGRNKKLSATKLAACLRKRTTDAEVRATIVAQLTGSPDAASLMAASKVKTDVCVKTSKK